MYTWCEPSLYTRISSGNHKGGDNIFMRKISEIKINKKGQLGNLQGVVLALVVVGILIGAGFFILEEFRTQAITIDNENSSAVKGINDTIAALQTVPDLLGLIVLIAIVGIILAIVFNVIPGARVSGV